MCFPREKEALHGKHVKIHEGSFTLRRFLPTSGDIATLHLMHSAEIVLPEVYIIALLSTYADTVNDTAPY
jgi:hypothetical protein